MKTLLLRLIPIAGVLMAAVCPVNALAYGFLIFVDCEYGPGIAPTNSPNPNIVCELTWEQTGPPRVNKVTWSGLVQVLANPAIKDTWITGQMDMRHTAQPVAEYIGCSDVAGIIQMYAYANSWENEGHGGGYALYQQKSDERSGEIAASHPCTPP